jgi:hypothetical protein
MASRRTSVERSMQRACGLPDERNPDDGWRNGAGGTRYMQVHLDVDAPKHDKTGQSLYLNDRGDVQRPVRVGAGEGIVDPLDYDRLR